MKDQIKLWKWKLSCYYLWFRWFLTEIPFAILYGTPIYWSLIKLGLRKVWRMDINKFQDFVREAEEWELKDGYLFWGISHL